MITNELLFWKLETQKQKNSAIFYVKITQTKIEFHNC
jgi:hypothetical protein